MNADRTQYADHLAAAALAAAVTLAAIVPLAGTAERRAKIEAFIVATATALEATAAAEWEPSERAMCRLYRDWQAMEGLHLGSADEHYYDPALPVEQRDWLVAFGDLWNEAEDREVNRRPRHG